MGRGRVLVVVMGGRWFSQLFFGCFACRLCLYLVNEINGIVY